MFGQKEDRLVPSQRQLRFTKTALNNFFLNFVQRCRPSPSPIAFVRSFLRICPLVLPVRVVLR